MGLLDGLFKPGAKLNPSDLSMMMMGAGANMMQASGPSLTPTNFGTALGAGIGGANQALLAQRDFRLAQQEQDTKLAQQQALQKYYDSMSVNSAISTDAQLAQFSADLQKAIASGEVPIDANREEMREWMYKNGYGGLYAKYFYNKELSDYQQWQTDDTSQFKSHRSKKLGDEGIQPGLDSQGRKIVIDALGNRVMTRDNMGVGSGYGLPSTPQTSGLPMRGNRTGATNNDYTIRSALTGSEIDRLPKYEMNIPGKGTVRVGLEDILPAIADHETRGLSIEQRWNAVNPDTKAFSPFQILPSTARDPGWGIDPLPKNASREEIARFAVDYFKKLVELTGSPTAAINAWYAGPASKEKHNGYVNAVMDNIWLRYGTGQAQDTTGESEPMTFADSGTVTSDAGIWQQSDKDRLERDRKLEAAKQGELTKGAIERKYAENDLNLKYEDDMNAVLSGRKGGETLASEQAKIEAEIPARIEGMDKLNAVLDEISQAYESLARLNALPDYTKGARYNIGIGAETTDLGQYLGKKRGTEAQMLREQVKAKRPLLLQMVAKASGMTAKQFDSDAERKAILDALTDPTQDKEMIFNQIETLRKLFGGKRFEVDGKTYYRVQGKIYEVEK